MTRRTAVFMDYFYHHLTQPQTTRGGAALRAAQIQLLANPQYQTSHLLGALCSAGQLAIAGQAITPTRWQSLLGFGHGDDAKG